MKSDSRLQQDVMEELRWEPFLNASAIGVSVKNGIVTLSGQVDSYAKKVLAERAVKRVAGVKAFAEDLQVGLGAGDRKTDTEIAEAVFNALKWNAAVQEERINIKVEMGMLGWRVKWNGNMNAVMQKRP
jgi:osmotically-inducible protein OsmY